jgi:hypothetical protein
MRALFLLEPGGRRLSDRSILKCPLTHGYARVRAGWDLVPGTGGDQDPDGAGRSALVGGSWGRLTGDMRADARSGPGQRTPREAAAGACRWTYEEDES